MCVCGGKKKREKARHTRSRTLGERGKMMEISESSDEPRQACWPSRRTLGPSAPAKSLSNLPNIYKIPANDPFITVQHHRRVYRLLCCFIPFNESHFHTVGISANEPHSQKFPRLGSRRSASAHWDFGFVPVVKVKMSKKLKEKPVCRS